MRITLKTFLFATFMLVLLLIPACQLSVESDLYDNPYIQFVSITAVDGTTIEFVLALPEHIDDGQSYPAVLAFPPGEQTYEGLIWMIDKWYLPSSIQNNWILIAPLPPNNSYFYGGAEIYVPTLMDWIQERYNVEGNKFHCSGVSAGGITSFRIAVRYPERVHSILAIPGWPTDADFKQLDKLIDIPVVMLAGAGEDSEVLDLMAETVDRLNELGGHALLQTFITEGHVLHSLTSTQVFSLLEDFRSLQ